MLGRIRKKSFYLILLFIFSGLVSFSQCDSTIKVNEAIPKYPGGQSKLIEDISSGINLYKANSTCNLTKVNVVVQFIVSSKGKVENVRMVKSSGCDNIDKEVISSIRRLKKFKPAIQDDVPTSFAIQVPILIDLVE